MKTIGIDLSINSTGVCIKEDNKYDYYLIVPKLTKKQQALNHPNLKYIQYDKKEGGADYSEKEWNKSISLYNIGHAIECILDDFKPDLAIIEGVSYGSGSGRVCDLAGLNFIVRSLLIKRDIHFKIISPMSNKKFAIGNGGAAKDVIVDSFEHLQPQFKGIGVKIDDIADAYFLANNI